MMKAIGLVSLSLATVAGLAAAKSFSSNAANTAATPTILTPAAETPTVLPSAKVLVPLGVTVARQPVAVASNARFNSNPTRPSTPAATTPSPSSVPTNRPPASQPPAAGNGSIPTVAVPVNLGLDEQLWGQGGDRRALLASIDNSLRYLNTDKAAATYQNYAISGITRDRVRRSLVRFRQLVVASKSAAELQAAVKREFTFYQSVGRDNQGEVKFTGYYEPIYNASRTQTAEYRYPLYRQPTNFDSWAKPHPTRLQLEGVDGLQSSRGPLAGSEIFWMRDRFEAVLVQIQGSATLKFADGKTTTVGFNGGTDFAYSSIGRSVAADGKLPLDGMTMQRLIRFFKENPAELDIYIPRYNRFVFMKETFNSPPMGSINVPVTADRSIATDKSLMPPGALALVHTNLPFVTNRTPLQIQQRLVSRYVLDQDTGSAITGPGRVDYFMGTGDLAGERAGMTGGTGRLYYLLLK